MYSPKHKDFYNKLSLLTGLSNEELDTLMLKIAKVIKDGVNRDGTRTIPYLGRFYIKRLPPRQRQVLDFGTKQRHNITLPAEDQLKFQINKVFSRIFK